MSFHTFSVNCIHNNTVYKLVACVTGGCWVAVLQKMILFRLFPAGDPCDLHRRSLNPTIHTQNESEDWCFFPQHLILSQ